MKVSHASGFLSWTTAIVAIAAVCSALAALLYGMNGPLSVVRVEGDLSVAERTAVQQAIQGSLESGYLTVNLADVSRAVLSLSWPRAVAVRRVWPASLHIEVSKEAVAARWGQDSALSSSGEVIRVPQPLGEEFPVFECAHADGIEAMHVYQLLRDGLRETDLEIAELEENDFGEWRARMKSGLVVLFGAEDLNRRVERFASVYRASLAARRNEIGTVDARYGNGVAVNWTRDAQREPASIGRKKQSGDTDARTGAMGQTLAVNVSSAVKN